MDTERNNHATAKRRIDWRRVGPWLLRLAILSVVVLGPWLFCYVAGLLNSAPISVLSVGVALLAWVVLCVTACVQTVRRLWAGRKMAAGFWLSTAFGIALAFVLMFSQRVPPPIRFFAHGVITHLDIQTDVDGIQTWVASLQPSDCVNPPRDGGPRLYLAREDQPKALQRQTGTVNLELDVEGRPSVRLTWNGGRAGTWGLVIGHKDMKAPPSGPGMYDEQRFELRPGIYFWYVEG